LFKLFTSLLVLVIKEKQSCLTSFTSEIQSLGLTFHPKLIGFSLFWIKIEFTQLNINFAAKALPVAFRCTPCLVKCSLFHSNFNNVASLKGFTIFISLCLKGSTSLLTQDVSGKSNPCWTPIKTILVKLLFFTK